MKETVASKILKSVVAKEGLHSVLECAHYENGNVIASDNYQLVRFNNVVENKDFEATINVFSLLPSNQKYPDVNRAMPKDFHLSVEFSTDTVKGLVKFLKAVKKEVIIMDLTGANSVSIRAEDSGRKHTIPIHRMVDLRYAPKKVAVEAQYLLHALQYVPDMIKDDKATGDIIIDFTTELQPLKLTFDSMEFVISPVRLKQ